MMSILNTLNAYLMNNQFVVLDKTTPHQVTNIKLVKVEERPLLLVDHGSLQDFELLPSQDGRFVHVGTTKYDNYEVVMELDAWSSTNLISLLNLMRNMGLSKIQWNTLTDLMTN